VAWRSAGSVVLDGSQLMLGLRKDLSSVGGV
jgi:hypothetical protein